MKYLLLLFFCYGVLAGENPLPRTVVKDAKLETVYADPRFFEGPAWDPKTQKLYFTAFGTNGPNDTQILRLDAPGVAFVWATNTEGVCGTWLGRDGRLLGAQAYGHRVLSYGIGPDGPTDVRILAADTNWNQPNDICQTRAGYIFFTDPDRSKQHAKSAVFRLGLDGTVSQVATDFQVPNGIICSPSGKTLYVSDSSRKLWQSYSILKDGRLGPGKVFFNPNTPNTNNPDGMTVDQDGNLYFCGRGGVWVVSPKGKSMGLISVPEFVSNATFGGRDGKTLYLTCKGKVYSLAMKKRGG